MINIERVGLFCKLSDLSGEEVINTQISWTYQAIHSIQDCLKPTI